MNGKEMIRKYHVIWDTQSENSSQSMPCGGFDTGANVWVEKGELFLYLDKSGSFDENNQMLKLGRIRFRFYPCVLEENFSQTLELTNGQCVVRGRNTEIRIWFDVHASACHVDVDSAEKIRIEVSYESWRIRERELTEKDRHAAASYVLYPGKIMTWPDKVIAKEDGILFYHRNRNEHLLFDFLMKQQGLEKISGQMYNPQKNRTFGGRLTGQDCTYMGMEEGEYAGVPFKGYILDSKEKMNHRFLVTLQTSQAESFEKWEEELEKAQRHQIEERNEILSDSLEWWGRFWERSYLVINEENDETDEGWRVARNYNLFRYMLACNAYGDYPTKFNGGLFIMDPCFSVPQDGRGSTPDFRAWGGGSFTAQNQRMVYWGMLKTGDFDMMYSQFDFYKRLLKNACLRTQEYWEHEGCSFTEQLENIGVPIGWAWGYPDIKDTDHCRPYHFDPTEERTPWLQYHYSTQLEFCWMILMFHRYTNEDIREYIPFIEQSILFYFEHYKMLHQQRCRHEYRDGKLVIAPSTALENYKGAVNPMDAVAGLLSITEELASLPDYVDTAKYKQMHSQLPPLPEGMQDGKKIFLPAEFWLHKMGDELPQLYTVFPYEFASVGSGKEEIGRNTWALTEGSERGYLSWKQGGIFTARLGLRDEAKYYCLKKLDNGPLRFPAFWGPGHDWLPDHNWGGSGMIGIQEMLVQQMGDTLYMLPAWPKEWNVSFKMHLQGGRIVQARVINGKVEEINIEGQDMQIVEGGA